VKERTSILHVEEIMLQLERERERENLEITIVGFLTSAPLSMNNLIISVWPELVLASINCFMVERRHLSSFMISWEI